MKYAVISLMRLDLNRLNEFDNINATLEWLDLLLESTTNSKFHFMTALNDLQRDFRASGLVVPDKDKFPLKIYNYILKQFNIAIVLE